MHRRRRWRIVVGGLAMLGALIVIDGVLVWRDLQPARVEVLAARDLLRKALQPNAFATPEKRAVSRGKITRALAKLTTARARIAGSNAISVVAFVPGLREQRAGMLMLLDDARSATTAVNNLLDSAESLIYRGQSRAGAVPLDSLQTMLDETDEAGTVLRTVQRRSSGLWGPLGDARHQLDGVAAAAAERLRQTSSALRGAYGFFGAHGPRRYLLTMMNNAEMRDEGMILSYGVVRFDQGEVHLDRRGTISDLRLDVPVSTAIPPGTEAIFGSSRPTALWQSVNATADFDWSRQTMAEMYRQATGETIDGVISLDIPGLAEVLTVIGPVKVAGIPKPISASNAGRVLLKDLYDGLSRSAPQGERREHLDEVVGAVFDRLANEKPDLVRLATALARASSGGHLRLWSTAPDEQQAFVQSGLSGGPSAVEPDRTFHLAVENRTATKLDYYVQPSVHQEVRFTGPNDVLVRTIVTIDNRAPSGAAASYQLGPDEYSARPGDYTAWVLLWGPAGAIQPASTSEAGLTLTEAIVSVEPGERRDVVFDTLIHDAVRHGELTLRLVPQPRLRPMDLTVSLDSRGRRVEGSTTWHGAWNQTRRMTWGVKPG
ncbi:MAG TPA: DUF4012 domain-containing protein [Acidimicrobiales bacterium]|nr:DUF4012 domain-containing protein [Acidimicrobiales bacterium]